MPRKATPLTDSAIKVAKPKDSPYKLTDGQGLYLEVTPNGSKLWRLKYRFDGKEKRLALGAYPAVSLQQARQRRTDARELLAQGADPSAEKKAAKQAQRADCGASPRPLVLNEAIVTHNAQGGADDGNSYPSPASTRLQSRTCSPPLYQAGTS